MSLPRVDDGPDLERRFGGLARLYGADGAARIRGAHVAVIGIGGVGSWTAEALARSGVAALTLIDLDQVSESNVNRQIHALTDTLGQAKVLAMQARIAQINPDCHVQAIEEFIAPGNLQSLMPDGLDGVIDASDQVAAKTALAAWALQRGMRFVTVGAAGGKRQAERVEIADIAQVTHDPLIAQVRYRLRRHHDAPSGGKRIGVPVVFSRENVAMPDACDKGADVDGTLNCHGYGSTVAVTATFGLCAAGWMLDHVASSA